MLVLRVPAKEVYREAFIINKRENNKMLVTSSADEGGVSRSIFNRQEDKIKGVRIYIWKTIEDL